VRPGSENPAGGRAVSRSVRAGRKCERKSSGNRCFWATADCQPLVHFAGRAKLPMTGVDSIGGRNTSSKSKCRNFKA